MDSHTLSLLAHLITWEGDQPWTAEPRWHNSMSQEWTGSMWGRETTPGLCLMQQLFYQHGQLLPSVLLDVLEKNYYNFESSVIYSFFQSLPNRKKSFRFSFLQSLQNPSVCAHVCACVIH